MAFSGSSYFAGIGTVFAAIAFGVACGSMVTTSVVQPPNRLERVNGGTTGQSKRDSTPTSTASSSAEQASMAKPVSQEAPASPVVAAAPTVPAADPQPAPPPQSPAPAAVKADAAANIQEQPAPAKTTTNSAPVPAVNSDDTAPAKSEHTTVGRAPDADREASRKRADKRRPSDDRKFSERRRRHDQDERQLDEATNVVRQMGRDETPDDIAERREALRYAPRPFGMFRDEDDSPRVIEAPPPPRFGLFGLGD